MKNKMKRILNVILLIIVFSLVITSCGKKFTPADVLKGKIKTYDSTTFDYIFVEAVKQKLMGNSGDALKYLEQCLKINPGSDAAYFQMAQILIVLGDNNNGKKFALKAYDLDKKNYWYLMMIAGTYYQEHNLDSAIIYYEQAAKNFPDKENLIMTLGNLYSENKKFDKAEIIFEGLDKKYGINKSSTVSSVRNLMGAQKYDEALEKVKLLLDQYPDEILFNGLLAEIYRGKGENGKAMEVYNKLIEENPDDPETQLSLCDFLINQKSYDELIIVLNKAILNDKITREQKIELVAGLIGKPEILKSYGDQLEISIMVLEASYNDDDIIVLLRPELLTAMNNLAEAASRLEEIIQKKPDNYFAWEKLLMVYFQKSDFVNLELKGKECATRFNRSFLAKLLYATAANENKNYIVALEELRKAIILAGENKELQLQVLALQADVYYRMKDYNKAFETFDEAMKNNKDDLTILNNYAYYLAEQNIRLKEAEIMAKKVIETEKSNNTFLDTYGWILYKRGKLREAAKVMEGIIKSGAKPDAEWFEHYGFILKKERNCPEAVKNWNISLKLDSTKTHLLKEIENCQGSR
jgi:tetratricopeptide (TPR) repeat protein